MATKVAFSIASGAYHFKGPVMRSSVRMEAVVSGGLEPDG